MTHSFPCLSVTVGICTRNRAGILRQALARLGQMRVPLDVTWELLVVDNGSTDETQSVLKTFSSSLPLRALHLTTPGKSRALNYATDHARGEYLIWTDDDVLVDVGWVSAYASAFRRWPDASFFGGPVEPWFDGSPPTWLANHWQQMANVFAVRQLGDSAFPFDTARVPFGANFAIKAAIQRQYPYSLSLGPRPGSEIRGEEIEIIQQMLAAGHTGWWVPDATVQHFVPRHRQSVAYLRRFFVGQGEVQIREFGRADVPRLFGRPRWLWKQALAAEVRYRWSRATAPPNIWLDHLRTAAKAWGYLKAPP